MITFTPTDETLDAVFSQVDIAAMVWPTTGPGQRTKGQQDIREIQKPNLFNQS
jgi:hypothetical protein